jgi:hypothetical protein
MKSTRACQTGKGQFAISAVYGNTIGNNELVIGHQRHNQNPAGHLASRGLLPAAAGTHALDRYHEDVPASSPSQIFKGGCCHHSIAKDIDPFRLNDTGARYTMMGADVP